MVCASPIWLIGLLPWGGAAVYLLRGHRLVQRVPFLSLWPREGSAAPKSKRQLPRLSVVLLLLASLLAILSLAQPAVSVSSRPAPPAVLVDRGIGLLPPERYQRLVDATCSVLSLCDAKAPMTVRFLPGATVRCSVSTLRQTLLAQAPEPVDTAAELPLALAELRATDAPMLLLSGNELPANTSRTSLLVLRDSQPVRNRGIEQITLTLLPSPQLMVRLYNHAPQSSVQVEVKGWQHGGGTRTPTLLFSLTRTVDLPAEGTTAARFLDLSPEVATDRPPSIVGVRLPGGDAIEADDEAWLVRQNSPARVLARGSLPPELARLLRAYTRVRQGGDATFASFATAEPEMVVTTAALMANETGLMLDPLAVGGGREASSLQAATVRPPDSLGQLPLPLRAMTAETSPPGAGWQTLVALGPRPVVSYRTSPSRQVWVGFWSAAWAQTSDYVVFYARILDWLAGDAGSYRAAALRADDRGLPPVMPTSHAAPWPGVYASAAGEMALNALVPFVTRCVAQGQNGGDATPATLPAQMAQLLTETRSQQLEGTGWVLALALAVMAIAAQVWRPRSA